MERICQKRNSTVPGEKWLRPSTYMKPVDGKVSGFYDLDMTEVHKALKEWNQDEDLISMLCTSLCVRWVIR